jgi:hypothetical protein
LIGHYRTYQYKLAQNVQISKNLIRVTDPDPKKLLRI